MSVSPSGLARTRTHLGRIASNAVRGFFYTFGVLIVALVLWQIATAVSPLAYFPTPLKIFERFGQLFFSIDPSKFFLGSATLRDVIPSLVRWLLGFGISVVVGIAVGTLIGLRRVLGEYVNPIVEFLRSIPATVTLPLFIILLGGGDGMRIAFIAFGLTWYVLINTASGVTSVEPGYLEMARAFRISRPRAVWSIVLPAALPQIIAGVRVSLTGALLLGVVSEYFLASNGIGYQLISAQQRFFFADMWAYIVLLAILGLVFNAVLTLLERRLLAWHSQSLGY